MTMWPGKCPYCDCEMKSHKGGDRKVTDDHIIPLSKGGDTHDRNTIYVCQKCNNIKANYLPYEADWFLDPRRASMTMRVLKVISDRNLPYPWNSQQKERINGMSTTK